MSFDSEKATAGVDEPALVQPADPAEKRAGGEAQSRYQMVERSGQCYLTCSGAGDIRLFITRGMTVTAEGRRKYPKQTIFLDGAYGPGPLLDNETRHYSLDHHNGCVRGFTGATCEQAAVMLMQGLPLDTGDWRIYINDPDLDAVLAAWLLLNHRELSRNGAVLLRQVMPFVRAESAIDSHGLDFAPTLSGLPEAVYQAQKERIDPLVAKERQAKAAGQWESIDLAEHTRALLDEIDRELYPEGYVESLLEIVELASASIEKKSKVAILCRSSQGIYPVESQLKQRHPELGLIVLENDDGRYTLRQVDTFLAKNLSDLYPVLNDRDDNAAGSDDEENVWGGSAEIGGCPRRTGTALSGEDILRIAHEVYGGGGWFKRLVRRLAK